MLNLTGGADYSQAHKARVMALKHSLRFVQYERVPIRDYTDDNQWFIDAVEDNREAVNLPLTVIKLADYLHMNKCALARFIGTNEHPMERNNPEKASLGVINPDSRIIDSACKYLHPNDLRECLVFDRLKVCRKPNHQRVLF